MGCSAEARASPKPPSPPLRTSGLWVVSFYRAQDKVINKRTISSTFRRRVYEDPLRVCCVFACRLKNEEAVGKHRTSLHSGCLRSSSWLNESAINFLYCQLYFSRARHLRNLTRSSLRSGI
ncbi:hypothetical protein PUN28_002561 [Cardiocondyla obscurior]|uniref:Uncharacterized protein n=1 Tax=Cardiocondyla obscurior TaxID=286306 RepID=A0AAW2GUS4_9HYME